MGRSASHLSKLAILLEPLSLEVKSRNELFIIYSSYQTKLVSVVTTKDSSSVQFLRRNKKTKRARGVHSWLSRTGMPIGMHSAKPNFLKWRSPLPPLPFQFPLLQWVSLPRAFVFDFNLSLVRFAFMLFHLTTLSIHFQMDLVPSFSTYPRCLFPF